MTTESGAHPGFKSTLWTVVLQARAGSESERRLALEQLCGLYWAPLYAYLRWKGLAREDAQDAIQGFFAYFLQQDLIDRAGPESGRFRGFLRGVLDRYLANERRKDGALKRGGDAVIRSLDFQGAERELNIEPSHSETPEAAFTRAWRMTVLEQAVDALRREYEAQGAGMRFTVLCAHLSATGERPSYEKLAQQLGCSVGDVTNLLHRARRRLGEHLRQVLRDTVDSDSEVEEEIRALFK